ncbi:MAG: NosD domain-containing protein, partial [Candidatus Thorarchaeota archaeon]
MASFAKHSQLILGLMVTLILVSPVILSTQQILPGTLDKSKGQTEGLELQDRFSPSYSTHSPITITSNADFEAQGFPGNGTPTNPYRIEGYNITTWGVCISIDDTNACFVILDCLLKAGGQNRAIDMDNVTHGMIRDNIFHQTSTCVYMIRSHNNTMMNNTMSGNAVGVQLWYSSYNVVVNNTITESHSLGGLEIWFSSDNVVVNNTISDNKHNGVFFWASFNNNIENNNISGNEVGVLFYETSNGINVINNTISGNDLYGVYFHHSSNNNMMILDNTVSENAMYGIYINSSSSNTVVNNTISGSEDGVYIEYSSNNEV